MEKGEWEEKGMNAEQEEKGRERQLFVSVPSQYPTIFILSFSGL